MRLDWRIALRPVPTPLPRTPGSVQAGKCARAPAAFASPPDARRLRKNVSLPPSSLPPAARPSHLRLLHNLRHLPPSFSYPPLLFLLTLSPIRPLHCGLVFIIPSEHGGSPSSPQATTLATPLADPPRISFVVTTDVPADPACSENVFSDFASSLKRAHTHLFGLARSSPLPSFYPCWRQAMASAATRQVPNTPRVISPSPTPSDASGSEYFRPVTRSVTRANRTTDATKPASIREDGGDSSSSDPDSRARSRSRSPSLMKGPARKRGQGNGLPTIHANGSTRTSTATRRKPDLTLPNKETNGHLSPEAANKRYWREMSRSPSPLGLIPIHQTWRSFVCVQFHFFDLRPVPSYSPPPKSSEASQKKREKNHISIFFLIAALGLGGITASIWLSQNSRTYRVGLGFSGLQRLMITITDPST